MKKDSGQALILLVFVTAIVMYWAVESAVLNLNTVENSGNLAAGQTLLLKAEGYLENAILQYIRNPAYSGESLQEEAISCMIELTDNGLNKDLNSTCGQKGIQRTVGTTVSFGNGIYTFSKIMEK